MKYMLMMTGNAKAFAEMNSWSRADLEAMIGFMDQVGTDLAERGELVDGNGLAGPDQLKVVQGDLVTDGPFSEAKEVLAGYWVVDVPDEQRAIDIARHISGCPGPGGEPLRQPIGILPVLGAPEA
jgi:hypothetical protein